LSKQKILTAIPKTVDENFVMASVKMSEIADKKDNTCICTTRFKEQKGYCLIEKARLEEMKQREIDDAAFISQITRCYEGITADNLKNWNTDFTDWRNKEPEKEPEQESKSKFVVFQITPPAKSENSEVASKKAQ
jgi:hypothetical protein